MAQPIVIKALITIGCAIFLGFPGGYEFGPRPNVIAWVADIFLGSAKVTSELTLGWRRIQYT
jgi:hypothetical protein